MSRSAFLQAFWLLAVVCVPYGRSATGGADFQDAMAALQRSDWSMAELKLRAELKANPNEAEALSLLGLALDKQKKFSEAGEAHKAAIAKAGDPGVKLGILHNYGNHFLFSGDPKGAHDAFLMALAIDPADDYSNLQLAQLAVQAKNGAEALQYLDRLPPQQMEVPNLAIVRLMALGLAGKTTEAEPLFNRLASSTQSDPNLSAYLGRELVQAGQFERAETFLTHALAADPSNFTVLYELGAVASSAGHNERARDLLETALRRQPQNVDVLYALAYVYTELKQSEAALRLLAQAEKLAPQRADIHKLLAVTTSDLHAYEDSVHEWDSYVALAPDDDEARRERGFARANIKQAEAGLADLEWYVSRHPDDPTGLFELGVSQSAGDPEKGLATLDKALALNPDMVEARAARGALYYQQGKAEPALADLEFAAQRRPDNATTLDRLGQTYLLLDRLNDALPVFRKAAGLAPADARIQLHVANALAEAGQTNESKIFMNRYKELGGAAAVPAHGVIDYVSQTPERQHADYRARVEKAVAGHPEDPSMQLAYLKLSVADGQLDKAASAAHDVEALKPSAVILADAGRAMLTAGQFAIAKELLDQAAAADPSVGVDLDLAVAVWHTDSPAASLQRLDRIPASQRGADYYVARSQMLEASGRPADSVAAMVQAVKADPERPDLYWQSAVSMVKNHRGDDALQLLDQAAKAMPQEAQIPVIRAAVLELSGKTNDALALLTDIQHRWPEAAAGWVARGLILAAHHHEDDARKCLETAVSLGAHSPETWYALADASFLSTPQKTDAAKAAIGPALKAAPNDPRFTALFGAIASGKATAAPAVDPAKLFLSKPPQDW